MTNPTPAQRALTETELNEIEARAVKMARLDWSVPEYDKAKPCMRRLGTIELIWLDNSHSVQVVPFSNGDVPMAEFITKAPNTVLSLLAEVRRLRSDIAAALVAERRAQHEADCQVLCGDCKSGLEPVRDSGGYHHVHHKDHWVNCSASTIRAAFAAAGEAERETGDAS